MIEIIFLGTSATVPTLNRSMPSIALRYNGDIILFDSGEGTQRRLLEEGLRYGRIKSIFISHNHIDHTLGLYGLIETIDLTLTKSINIFIPEDFPFIKKWDKHNIVFLKSNEIYDFGAYVVKVINNNHKSNSFSFMFQEKDSIRFDKEKSLKLGLKGRMFKEIQEKGKLNGIHLEDITYIKRGVKIVYSGDTMYCKDLINFSKHADILIHESTFSEKEEKEAKEKFHSTSKDAALIAKEADVKQLILTHFSARYKDESILCREAEQYFKNVLCAYDGFKITI